MLVSILLLSALGLFIYNWWQKTRIVSNFPPGPYGLPVVGNVGVMASGDLIDGLVKLHDEHGAVCSVNLGPGGRSVFIGDYEALKEGNFRVKQEK